MRWPLAISLIVQLVGTLVCHDNMSMWPWRLIHGESEPQLPSKTQINLCIVNMDEKENQLLSLAWKKAKNNAKINPLGWEIIQQKT